MTQAGDLSVGFGIPAGMDRACLDLYLDLADLRSRIGNRAASDPRQRFSPASIGSRYLERLGLLALRGRTRR